MTIKEKIKKLEKELLWIENTINSLKDRKQHKLKKIMELKIQELKFNKDTSKKTENKCIMNLEVQKRKLPIIDNQKKED